MHHSPKPTAGPAAAAAALALLLLAAPAPAGGGEPPAAGSTNTGSANTASAAAESAAAAPAAFEPVDELKTPGIETELSGIYPHLTDPDLYYVVTNGKPPYKPTMQPMLPVELRNRLLTVDRRGKVVAAVELPDGGGLFGDIAFGDGHLWLGPLDPPELWKVDPGTGRVVAQYPLPGPAGGLDFDRERNLVVVQNYIGHPHLALVDARTGAMVGSLWSDENCQGVAKVAGDLLTMWTSSWDADAYTELWHLDEATGRPMERLPVDGIHAAMAPLDPKVAGFEGFMTLVHVDSGISGETVIRRFRYANRAQRQAATEAPARSASAGAAPASAAPPETPPETPAGTPSGAPRP